MKKLVRQVVLLLCPAIQGGISVLMVPQNRMADGGEMGADLMGPARHQQDFEKGQFPSLSTGMYSVSMGRESLPIGSFSTVTRLVASFFTR